MADSLLKEIFTKPIVGLAYIIVPSDVNRVDYIEDCYSNEHVSIYPESGGTSLNNIKITKEALQCIEFPRIGENFGSQVVYLRHHNKKLPIIIASLSKLNESETLMWKQFKQKKSFGENEVSIIGDAKNGGLYFSVKCENSTGGEIFINLNRTDGNGKFVVEVRGDITFVSRDYIIRNSTTKFLSRDKISLGIDNYEPAVLGTTLKNEILGPLISTLKELRVATAMGPSGAPLPNTLSSLIQIEQKLNKILSKKVELE